MFTTLDIEEKRVYWRKKGNKYLVFHSTDEKKEVLKNMQMFGMKSKTKSKK